MQQIIGLESLCAPALNDLEMWFGGLQDLLISLFVTTSMPVVAVRQTTNNKPREIL